MDLIRGGRGSFIMTVTREDLNPCTVQLAVVCTPEEVAQGFEKAFKQLAKKVKLPGFRPGHAPKAMVEKFVQKNDLYEGAADTIVRDAFKHAVEEHKLEPDRNIRPHVDIKLLDQEKGTCEFNVKIGLPPVVEMGDPKGLPIERPKVEVSEEEVEYQIEELRKRRSIREPITDRGVMEGDVAVVNVKIDGEPGEGRNFMTIAGQTFPQLDQALMGMHLEEMKLLDLTFPENFQEKDWAGKPLKCQISINSVSSVKPPELDDSFAQSLKTDNLVDLRTRLKVQIERAKEEMVRDIVTEQLLDKLLERSTVHVADPMWETVAARRLQDTAIEQEKLGKTMEEYSKENGMTVEELVEAWKKSAHLHVKRALLINKVRETEKILLDNQDLNQELYRMAMEFEVQPDEMIEMLKKNQAMDDLHFRAISRKVVDFLLAHADVKEVAIAAKV